jgi:hypothetical protein
MKKISAVLGTIALALSLGAPVFAAPAPAPQHTTRAHSRHHRRAHHRHGARAHRTANGAR